MKRPKGPRHLLKFPHFFFLQNWFIRAGFGSQLNDVGVIGTEEQEPLARVLRADWGMPYADDAGIVSKSAEGFANIHSMFQPFEIRNSPVHSTRQQK